MRASSHRWEQGFAELLCIFAWVAIPAAARDDLPTSPPVGDCGSRALYCLLALEGKPTSPEQIRLSLPPLPERGHSMKELRDAGRAFGLRLVGTRLSGSSWRIDRPMIVFLSREGHGHFIVARPVGHTGHLVQVIDPSGPTTVLDATALFDRLDWTGLALVPSLSPAVTLTLAALPGMLVLTGVTIWWARRRPRVPATAL